MASIVAVHKTLAGRIPNEIRHKRSHVLKCEERVISRNPCEMKTCPHGQNGSYEMLFYECPRITDFCPMSVKNNSATCCPEKCVCSNGQEMFQPGTKFMAEKDGKHLECMCGMDKVPSCQEVLIVPPKEPPKPPPVFPPFGKIPPEEENE